MTRTDVLCAAFSANGRVAIGAQFGHVWVLEPGEVAEFDTTVPHWFGSTGEAPAEMLSIFGRPGERIVGYDNERGKGDSRAGKKSGKKPEKRRD